MKKMSGMAITSLAWMVSSIIGWTIGSIIVPVAHHDSIAGLRIAWGIGVLIGFCIGWLVRGEVRRG